MQILLRVGSAEYVLAHGATRGVGLHMGPASIRHNAPVRSQVDELLRGTAVQVRNRGNLTTRFSFQVEVELATLDAAELYAVNYPQTLPREGKLRFVMTDGNGAPTVREITTAVIEDVALVQQTGVSLTIAYTVVGSGVTNVTAD